LTANTSTILLLTTGKRKQADLLTVKLQCGRYMAMVARPTPEDPRPLARLVISTKQHSLLRALEELLELVSEDLYKALQWNID